MKQVWEAWEKLFLLRGKGHNVSFPHEVSIQQERSLSWIMTCNKRRAIVIVILFTFPFKHEWTVLSTRNTITNRELTNSSVYYVCSGSPSSSPILHTQFLTNVNWIDNFKDSRICRVRISNITQNAVILPCPSNISKNRHAHHQNMGEYNVIVNWLPGAKTRNKLN